MSNSNSRKAGKAFVASSVGICLLLGGGTYALWSANAPMNSEATITAGDLRLSSMSSQNWFDVSKPATPVELVDLSGFYMVPGDKLQLNQDINLVIVGDNISGKLTVELPNSTESVALLAQAKFTLKVFSPSGEELISVVPSTNSNVVEAEVPNLPQTSPAGETYSIQVQVELPASADNATKLQASVLEDAIVTLEQGDKYLDPSPIANPQSDFSYASAGVGVSITKYLVSTSDVVIPSSVVLNGVERPVVRIDADAFKSKQLDSVYIPDTVTEIRQSAFSSTGLKSVRLSKNLTTIGNYAFQGANLTAIDLPKSLTTLGAYTFAGNKITSVQIPPLITYLPEYVFSQNLIDSLTFASNSSLTSIGNGAFAQNKITELNLPESLKTVYGGAFRSNLFSTIVIPAQVISIEDSAFDSQNLRSVYMEGNAPKLTRGGGNGAFGSASTPGRIVYYHEGATGYSNPWNSYKTAIY